MTTTRDAQCNGYQPSANPMDQGDCANCGNSMAAHSTPATEQQGYVEGLGLKRIVEEVDGAMRHGTWRDAHGMRLKDTPEWVAFYVALAQIGAKP